MLKPETPKPHTPEPRIPEPRIPGPGIAMPLPETVRRCQGTADLCLQQGGLGPRMRQTIKG